MSPSSLEWSPMNYRNSEMKIDQLIGYLNEDKINLSPVFQRGHVWKVATRKKLMKNIVQGRPIPAIFLYKEAAGTRYSYNILDGKQRLESIILFVASSRPELAIRDWHKYFFGENHKQQGQYSVALPDGDLTFQQLDEGIVRDFREYAIPTIEITLTDESSLDEIINLFVDINQEGVAVSRFAVVKAMGKKNSLLNATFNLIAEKQTRGNDIFYRSKNNEFTKVLKTLKIVASTPDANSKVDRMWERLLEFILFVQTGQHRPPAEVLKGFITNTGSSPMRRPTSSEVSHLRRAFRFIHDSYSCSASLRESSLAINQVHFYTMVTSLLVSDLLQSIKHADLVAKIDQFGRFIDKIDPVPEEKALRGLIKNYLNESQTQTTHVGRRDKRQKYFIDAIRLIKPGEDNEVK